MVAGELAEVFEGVDVPHVDRGPLTIALPRCYNIPLRGSQAANFGLVVSVVLLLVQLVQEYDHYLGTHIDNLLGCPSSLLVVVIAEALDYILRPNSVNPVYGTVHIYNRVGLAAAGQLAMKL